MKNSQNWFPTKFQITEKKARGSRDSRFLSVSSQMVADITASFYHNYLRKYAKGKLIDLGCGSVPLYEMYRPFIVENVCVDWPNSAHKNQYIDVEYDLNKPLPFSDCEFDTIVLSDVLEHIREPQILIKEMNRILKPGGYVIMNVPFFYKLHEIPHDYYRYSKFALQNFALEAKFKIIVLQEMGGLMEIIVDLGAKIIIKLPLLGKYLSSGFQTLCSWVLSFKLVKKISVKSHSHYPLGYFLIMEK